MERRYFTGEYEGKMDAKHRVVLPARLKSQLPEAYANSLVITRGFEPCLVLYAVTAWKLIVDKVMELSEFNEECRTFQRNFLRGSTEVELDNMGRFIVPKTLLKYAQLEKEIMIVGVGNRMELWASAIYEAYLIQDGEAYSKLAEKYLGKQPNELYKFIVHQS